MATAKEVQVWITIGAQVYEVCEKIYGKVSEWLAPDLAIDCPHCGESQTYDLGTLKEGLVFSIFSLFRLWKEDQS